MNEPQLQIDRIDPPLISSECEITAAVRLMSQSSSEERAAIFTKKEIVHLILDLAGYTEDKDLASLRILEPACGEGDFLIPIIERLLSAWRQSKSVSSLDLKDAVKAVEVHEESFKFLQKNILTVLKRFGVPSDESLVLIKNWLVFGDFLLAPLDGEYDFVVGNPPYLRHEQIPKSLMHEYKKRYTTIFDRADLYVPFIERSLNVLSEDGKLSIICADRWMKNRYGSRLRSFVSENFNLDIHIDMTDVDAFHSEVIAYPAISVISRGPKGITRIGRAPELTVEGIKSVKDAVNGTKPSIADVAHNIVNGDQPWIMDNDPALELVRKLEANFSTMSEVGCKVGIGVATGADRIYIKPYDELDIEPDCKLRLATTKDIKTGKVEWQGLGIVNPFGADGSLVELDHYPKLAAYLEEHREAISKRHVAKKSPKRWYKTIDRIYPELTTTAKLLIPDIKGSAQIVYEPGNLYPHHNLYFITSDKWNLEALQKVLTAGIAHLFVSAYSTKMRGGYLRFQAQYLRRIRLPKWSSLNKAQKDVLTGSSSTDAVNCIIAEIYGLNDTESCILRSIDRKNDT